MPIHNTEIAEVLHRMADLLEIEGANPFRVRAYRHAAHVVSELGESLHSRLQRGSNLTELPGIGKDLAGKITEIAGTGTLHQLRELEARYPRGLTTLLQLSTLGPNRVRTLHERLGIGNLDQLERAAREAKVRTLPGFGEKTEAKILREVDRVKRDLQGGRMLLRKAEQIMAPFFEYLHNQPGLKQLVIAGSYRRRRETVGDIDMVATVKRGSDFIDRFAQYEDVVEVFGQGPTKASVLLRRGLQVDLRVVPEVSFGAALLYFTGSKPHSVVLRTIAQKRGLKVNEYGVYREKDNTRLASRTEEEMYAALSLPYIEPELREDRGEIEAARKGQLPKLVDLKDIRGDLQSHTTASDGRNTLEEMAKAARDRGYEYLAVTDHSKRVTIANGLDERRLRHQINRIDRLNKRLDGSIRVLRSVEVDILEDGSLDLDNEVLKDLDIVICSVHFHTKLSREQQTERVLKAMDNPYFHIFAHPTGRILNKRDPYELDVEAVLRKAKEVACFVELNAHPDRLDLNDTYVRLAKEMGVKVAISTDAHAAGDFAYMRYGVGQARRGWLEAGDVLNTRSWPELQKLLRR